MQGARDALERYGTGLTGSRLLNGTIPLHLELEARARRLDGHRGRASSSPPATRRTSGRSARSSRPGDTVVADSADHASILDGCLLSRAKLRAFRHNRLDKLERQLERAAGDGGGVLVVVDGVFSMEGDVAPLPEIADLCRALRRAADGRRGPRRRRARRARRRRQPSCSASRTASTCGWGRSRSRWPPAAASSPARPRSSSSCASSAAPSCSPPPRVPAAVGAALAALRIVRSAEGPQLMATRARERALPARRPARARLQGRRARGRRRRHARSSPSSSRTTGRPRCCGRRSTRPASSSTSPSTPPSRPGGALLRTSVMATHDEATLDRALDTFSAVKRRSRPSTGRSPRPDAPATHRSRRPIEKAALSDVSVTDVDRCAMLCRSFAQRVTSRREDFDGRSGTGGAARRSVEVRGSPAGRWRAIEHAQSTDAADSGRRRGGQEWTRQRRSPLGHSTCRP